MIRAVAFCVAVLAVVSSNADPIDYGMCHVYPENPEAPQSVELLKSDDGTQLKVNFWANNIDQNSVMKIKHLRQGMLYSVNLVNVLYPITDETADMKYKEYELTVPVPEMEANMDNLQVSLHRVVDKKESAVFCFTVTTKALNGIKEDPLPSPPVFHAHPPANA